MQIKQKGFTLVEIMIVVAILALIVSISVPTLLRLKHNANESAAQASLRIVSGACESWLSNNTTYPATLLQLSGAIPPYIDAVLSSGAIQGYGIIYTLGVSGLTFTAIATPTAIGVTGTRVFTITESGVITAV